jgi:hypothetical protein
MKGRSRRSDGLPACDLRLAFGVSVGLCIGLLLTSLPLSWRSRKLLNPNDGESTSTGFVSRHVQLCHDSAEDQEPGALMFDLVEPSAIKSTQAGREKLTASFRTHAPALNQFEKNLQSKILSNVCIRDTPSGTPELILIGNKDDLSRLNQTASYMDIFLPDQARPIVQANVRMAYTLSASDQVPDTFTWVPGFSLHMVPMSNINHNLYDRVLPALAYAMCLRRSVVDDAMRQDMKIVLKVNRRFKSYPKTVWCQWLPVLSSLSLSSVQLVPEGNSPVCFEQLLLSWRSEMRSITSIPSLPDAVAYDAMWLYRASLQKMFLSPRSVPDVRQVNVLIYARSDASRKILLNGKSVLLHLRRHYQRFNITLLDESHIHLPSVASFSTQVQDYSLADVIICPHGAWSAHAPIMKFGGVLMELCSPLTWFWPPLRNLTHGLMVPVRNCSTSGMTRIGGDTYYTNLTVDIPSLLTAFGGVVVRKGWM